MKRPVSLATVPLATVPLATVPLATVPLATVPLATVPLATVPLATVPALFVFLGLLGCNASPSTAAPSSSSPAGLEAAEPAKGRARASRASGTSGGPRGPKWRFTYQGALEGSVEGSVLTVIDKGMPNTITLAGGGFDKERTAKATAKFSGRIVTGGPSPTAVITLTLADGTQCRPASSPLAATVTDAAPKTFQAVIKGSLRCDGDKDITFEGTLVKKPT